MTGSRLRLEDFSAPETSDDGDRLQMTVTDREELRLAAFEKGYTAGWDDAVAAQENEGSRLRADLARNMLDLSFSYHEARIHVLRAMEPLLQEMVAKVLPAVARQSIGPIVLEALGPLAAEIADTPISVVLNPASLETVSSFLDPNGQIPLRFVEEANLGEGQVHLQFGDTETRIDLDGVISAIGAAISAYFETQKETADG
ncbi:flagellar biosynthesis protein [Ostreiculturibacter nitratireducens]|uniref:FliH/SctL family protein n=1 Tax=Ostreiculturibacter nitratireducens TaxID=3075226 RepID=UPI0031B5FE28